jgi:hypothetical protein
MSTTALLPAAAVLKADPEQTPLAPMLARLLAEKGISSSVLPFFVHQSPTFVRSLLGHLALSLPWTLAQVQQAQRDLLTLALPEPQYRGTIGENREIDQAISKSSERSGLRASTWRGCASAYERLGLRLPPALQPVPIVIIGAGPAGILAARALVNIGFRNLAVIDKTGTVGGIWQKQALQKALMAVPYPLRFERLVLPQAPRPGQEVTEFLQCLVCPPPSFGWPAFPKVVQGEVLHVLPGDLNQQVIYQDAKGHEHLLKAPLVINAVGVGEPLAPCRPGVMTTDVAADRVGTRWQEVWSEQEARRYRDQNLVFVSLSNATLEMLRQIQYWNHRGMNIGYHVITHYPQECLDDPHARVEYGGHAYRLFRSIERSQLLRLAGDVMPVRLAFEEADAAERITSQVTHWSLEQRMVVAVRDDGRVMRLPCDALFTLIGYGPRNLEQMGLSVNHPYLGAVDQDVDGEAQREAGVVGRARVWPGMFCFGIRNASNPNEVLLPGLFYRLPNLLVGLILRAAEVACASSHA